MISDQFGLILRIFAILLMAAGVIGVLLALSLSKLGTQAAKPSEVVQEAAVRPVDEEAVAARQATYRRGLYVLIGLAVLTALEFLVAMVLSGSTVLLFVIILAKAGLILQYYMHMGQVLGEGEAH